MSNNRKACFCCLSLNPHSFSRTAMCVIMSTMILEIVVHLFSAIKPESRSHEFRGVQAINVILILLGFIGAFASCRGFSRIRKKKYKRVRKTACFLTVVVTVVFVLNVMNVFIAPKAMEKYRENRGLSKWGGYYHHHDHNGEHEHNENGETGNEGNGDYDKGGEADMGENNGEMGDNDGEIDDNNNGEQSVQMGEDMNNETNEPKGDDSKGEMMNDNQGNPSDQDENKEFKPAPEQHDPNEGHPRLLEHTKSSNSHYHQQHEHVYKKLLKMDQIILFGIILTIFLWQLSLLCGLMKIMKLATENPEIMDLRPPQDHVPARLRQIDHDVERGEFRQEERRVGNNNRDDKGNFVRFDDMEDKENNRGI